MKFRNVGVVAAAEDLEEVTTVEGDGDVGLEPEAEVVEQEATIDSAEDAGDAAADDVGTLEEIKDILEEAADNGDGIDATAAKVVEVAVESIMNRLGMEYNGLVGSAESFSNTRSRVSATRMAAEAIGETVSRAWEAIKKFFKNIWENIKSFVKSIFTSVGRLKSAAAAMQNKIATMPKHKKEDSFTNSTLANYFSSSKTAVYAANEIADQVKKTADSINGLASIKKLIENSFKGEESERNGALIGILSTLHLSKMEGNKSAASLGLTADEQAFGLMTGIGGNDVYIVTRKSAADTDSKKVADSSAVAKVMITTKDFSIEKDIEIKVAEAQTLRQIASNVELMANNIDRYNKDNKYLDRIDKTIEKMTKINDTDTTTAKAAKYGRRNERFAVMRAMLGLAGGISTKPVSLAVKGGFMALKFVQASMAQYGTE